jgi:hypothetical protein
MKAASILIALVFVLGFATEAAARELPADAIKHKHLLKVFGCQFGFVDWIDDSTSIVVGEWVYPVPFTATQSLVGFCVIVVGLFALVTMLTFRWKRKAANQK